MDLNDLKNVRVGEVEKPKPLPEGFYLARISGAFTTRKAKSGNMALVFPFTLVEPHAEVDPEALEVAGGVKPDTTRKLEFWTSPDALYRFTDFVSAVSGGASTDMNIIEAANWLSEEKAQFIIQVKHDQDENDHEKVYARFDNPVAIS